MRRRDCFLAALIIAAAAPDLSAQTGARTPRVGILIVGTAASTGQVAQAVIDGMREHGFDVGKNIHFETRYGDGSVAQATRNARSLVDAKVDVIAAPSTAAVSATRNVTATLPVVFCAVSDAVEQGFARSLSVPGGNVTGLSLMSAEMAAKRLEILSELLPALKRIGILHDPKDPASRLHVQAFLQSAKLRGMETLLVEGSTPAEFDKAFSSLEKWRAEAIAIAESASYFTHRKAILARAAQNHWPTVNSARQFAVDGGVVSYGVDYIDTCRRSAAYIARILKGAKASDLPIERPSKFEFVVNLKAARATGISVPRSILLRADEVIE